MRTSTRQQKKKNYDKTMGRTPLFLTEGDLDEIGDVIHDATRDMMSHFEAEYQQSLNKVQ